MKITFFISDWGGCGYYRCVVPAQYLIKNGITFKIETEYSYANIDKADIIVMQRQFKKDAIPWQIYAIEQGKKVVFECDDDIFNVPKWNPTYEHWSEVKDSAIELMRHSHLVTVTNDALKRQFSKYNNNVVVLPNSIDFGVIRQLEEKDLFLQILELDRSFKRKPFLTSKIINEKERGAVNIGWAGSFTHEKDLPILDEVMPYICKKNPNVIFYNVGFICQSLIDRMRGLQLRMIEGVDTPKYMGLLKALRLDIGLAPIKRVVFNEGKSNLKSLEYLSVGAVPVATNFGHYAETLENYTTGFLCSDDPAHWIKVIQKLIDQKALRENMARDGYEMVKAYFNIEHNWQFWYKAYSDLLD